MRTSGDSRLRGKRVIRVWRHYIAVEPLGNNRCRYEDCIEIDTGALGLAVSAFAGVFFRYRRRRWARLAALLAAAADVPLAR